MMGSWMPGKEPPNDLKADAMPVGEAEPRVEAMGPVMEETG